jgi:predicted tellurium resistance membrane protein TerC
MLLRNGGRAMDDRAMTAAVIEIVLLNLMLAGDSAMFLAVATKALPQAQRRLGVNLGAILLMVSRGAVLFAAISLAPLPGFGLFCAVALIASAVFTAQRGEAPAPVPAKPLRDLPALLRAVLGQDAPAALANMLALQAATQGHTELAWLGLAVSFPMLALGAAGSVALFRKPPLLWGGALLLGWLAGQAAAADALLALTPTPPQVLRDFAPPTSAALALLAVFVYLRRHRFQRLSKEDQ